MPAKEARDQLISQKRRQVVHDDTPVTHVHVSI